MDILKQFRQRVLDGRVGPESAWTHLLAWMEQQEAINREVASFIAHLKQQAATPAVEANPDICWKCQTVTRDTGQILCQACLAEAADLLQAVGHERGGWLSQLRDGQREETPRDPWSRPASQACEHAMKDRWGMGGSRWCEACGSYSMDAGSTWHSPKVPSTQQEVN